MTLGMWSNLELQYDKSFIFDLQKFFILNDPLDFKIAFKPEIDSGMFRGCHYNVYGRTVRGVAGAEQKLQLDSAKIEQIR